MDDRTGDMGRAASAIDFFNKNYKIADLFVTLQHVTRNSSMVWLSRHFAIGSRPAG